MDPAPPRSKSSPAGSAAAPAAPLARFLPDVAGFALRVLVAAGADLVLHSVGLASTGLYAGYLGTALVASSFAHSARKRRLVGWGSARGLLVFHEAAARVGPLLILIHGGFHFHAVLPWLAMASMCGASWCRRCRALRSLRPRRSRISCSVPAGSPAAIGTCRVAT